MNRTLKKILPLALSLSALLLSSCGDNSSDSHKEEDYELAVTLAPERRTYLVDTNFDSTGMEVRLRLKNSNSIGEKVEYTVLDGTHLDLEQTSVTIAYRSYRTSLEIKVKEKFHIACIGDSLTEGHMWPAQSYPSYLAKKVPEHFEVGNFGKNGISITGYGGSWDNPEMRYIKQEYYKNSIAYEPDILAIMLGTNDATGWEKAAPTFLAEYKTLLKAYKDALPFAKTIMMVSPPTKEGNQFGIPNNVIKEQVNPIQRQLAEDNGYEILDLRKEFEETENYESLYLRPYDGVHFTETAADYVATRVWDIAKDLKF